MATHDYDGALKLLLRTSAHSALREITGAVIEKWLDVELHLGTRRPDLLGETSDGRLIHLEIQTKNDGNMPLRMAEYGLGVYRMYGKFPRQFCVYVGRGPIRMEPGLRLPGLRTRFSLIDISTIDGKGLLESPEIGDNVIAILTRVRNHKAAIRQIVGRLGGLTKGAREVAFQNLLTLAGLRRMAAVVQEERAKMPFIIDLRENEVLGPPYKKGLAEGIEKGMAKGLRDGERRILQRLIVKRFGALSAADKKRLKSMSAAELEQLSERVLDARSISELLH